MFPVCYFCQRKYVAQRLVNRVFNETGTHLCFYILNGFQLVMGL